MKELKDKLSWEEAVFWFCNQKTNEQAVLDNYFDEDVFEAAERFSKSKEFAETLKLLPEPPKKLLEIGAGRGIASFGFAKKGYDVTALEPDQSDFVGAGSIRKLVALSSSKISIETEYGENLPFKDNSFDIVYVRQVLHHARNLDSFCAEVSRVLVKNGVFIAVREHIVDNRHDLKIFLNNHPLHHLYGGENAYTLSQYLFAIKEGGLNLFKKLAPYDSDINLFPSSKEKIKTALVLNHKIVHINFIFNLTLKFFNFRHRTPGRLYSFIAYKP